MIGGGLRFKSRQQFPLDPLCINGAIHEFRLFEHGLVKRGGCLDARDS
jgi:hypothetical protein